MSSRGNREWLASFRPVAAGAALVGLGLIHGEAAANGVARQAVVRPGFAWHVGDNGQRTLVETERPIVTFNPNGTVTYPVSTSAGGSTTGGLPAPYKDIQEHAIWFRRSADSTGAASDSDRQSVLRVLYNDPSLPAEWHIVGHAPGAKNRRFYVANDGSGNKTLVEIDENQFEQPVASVRADGVKEVRYQGAAGPKVAYQGTKRDAKGGWMQVFGLVGSQPLLGVSNAVLFEVREDENGLPAEVVLYDSNEQAVKHFLFDRDPKRRSKRGYVPVRDDKIGEVTFVKGKPRVTWHKNKGQAGEAAMQLKEQIVALTDESKRAVAEANPLLGLLEVDEAAWPAAQGGAPANLTLPAGSTGTEAESVAAGAAVAGQQLPVEKSDSATHDSHSTSTASPHSSHTASPQHVH